MKCNNCNSDIFETQKFCMKCGNKLVNGEGKQKSKDNKPSLSKKSNKKIAFAIISVLLIIIFTSLVLFKDHLLHTGYTFLASKYIDEDIDKALVWADKAYSINSDLEIHKKIYKRQYETTIENDPEEAIKYLKKLARIDRSNDYSDDFEEAYIIAAESYMDADIDKAVGYIEKALETNRSKKTIDMLRKVSIRKADELSEKNNKEEALQVLKNVLQYDDSDEIKSKIIELHINEAEMLLESDIHEAIRIAERSKEYGDNEKIDEFIARANVMLEEENEGEREIIPVSTEPITWDLVDSSSTLTDEYGTYHNYHICDDDSSTAWVEGVDGDGLGEWIALIKHDSVTLNKIEIHNGYKKSDKTYFRNNRLKTALIEFSDGSSFNYNFEDEYSKVDIIELPNPVSTYYIKLTIVDVYKGDAFQDTCITEIKGF